MDIGRTIKKYDVYYTDCNFDEKGVKHCVVVSDNTLPNVYLAAPIVTNQYANNINRSKAELIVNTERQNGKIYVPVRLEKNSYKFIDITNMRPITGKQLQGYYRTISSEDVKSRIDKELDFFIKGIYSPHKNCDDNTDIDAFYIIRKYDIWSCHTTNKSVDCIVLQADMLNKEHPAQYLVAPVHTETPANRKINRAALHDYMKTMSSSILVPFKMSDNDEYSFIDITGMHTTPANRFHTFRGNLVNKDIREFIDDSMMRMIFDTGVKTTMRDYTHIVKDIPEVTEVTETVVKDKESKDSSSTNTVVSEPVVEEPVKNPVELKTVQKKEEKEENKEVKDSSNNTYPDDWEFVYSETVKGGLTETQAAELLNLSINEFTFVKNRYINETKTAKKKRGRRESEIPKDLPILYEKYKRGKLTLTEVAERINKSTSTTSRLIKKHEEQLHQKAVNVV